VVDLLARCPIFYGCFNVFYKKSFFLLIGYNAFTKAVWGGLVFKANMKGRFMGPF